MSIPPPQPPRNLQKRRGGLSVRPPFEVVIFDPAQGHVAERANFGRVNGRLHVNLGDSRAQVVVPLY
jgi:hypothetical protein